MLGRSAAVMSARPMRTEPEAEKAETETPPRAGEPPARAKAACAAALLEEAVGRAEARGPETTGAEKEAARAVILPGSLRSAIESDEVGTRSRVCAGNSRRCDKPRLTQRHK